MPAKMGDDLKDFSISFEDTTPLPGLPTSQEAHEINLIKERLSKLEEGHVAINVKLQANTIITQSVKDDTSELVSLFKGMKTIGEMFFWIGKIAKWITMVAGAGLVIWGVLYTLIHGLPPPPENHTVGH